MSSAFANSSNNSGLGERWRPPMEPTSLRRRHSRTMIGAGGSQNEPIPPPPPPWPMVWRQKPPYQEDRGTKAVKKAARQARKATKKAKKAAAAVAQRADHGAGRPAIQDRPAPRRAALAAHHAIQAELQKHRLAQQAERRKQQQLLQQDVQQHDGKRNTAWPSKTNTESNSRRSERSPTFSNTMLIAHYPGKWAARRNKVQTLGWGTNDNGHTHVPPPLLRDGTTAPAQWAAVAATLLGAGGAPPPRATIQTTDSKMAAPNVGNNVATLHMPRPFAAAAAAPAMVPIARRRVDHHGTTTTTRPMWADYAVVPAGGASRVQFKSQLVEYIPHVDGPVAGSAAVAPPRGVSSVRAATTLTQQKGGDASEAFGSKRKAKQVAEQQSNDIVGGDGDVHVGSDSAQWSANDPVLMARFAQPETAVANNDASVQNEIACKKQRTSRFSARAVNAQTSSPGGSWGGRIDMNKEYAGSHEGSDAVKGTEIALRAPEQAGDIAAPIQIMTGPMRPHENLVVAATAAVTSSPQNEFEEELSCII